MMSAASLPQLDMSSPMSPSADGTKSAADPMPTAGHMMSPDDPDNPQNWPLHKKVYVSAAAFAFAWVV